MTWINEKDRAKLKKDLEILENEIKIIFFTQNFECQYCRETRDMLTELVELSPKLKLEVYDFVADSERAKSLKIDKIPAFVVTDNSDTDYGLYFYGIPAGYEFVSLLNAVKIVSQQKTTLKEESIELIRSIDQDVHIQVFVTPTCPYCPMAVELGHNIAFHNKNIRADMVEASEFAHLANKYNIMGVPKIIINETAHFEGALPEDLFIEELVKAIQNNNAALTQ